MVELVEEAVFLIQKPKAKAPSLPHRIMPVARAHRPYPVIVLAAVVTRTFANHRMGTEYGRKTLAAVPAASNMPPVAPYRPGVPIIAVSPGANGLPFGGTKPALAAGHALADIVIASPSKIPVQARHSTTPKL